MMIIPKKLTIGSKVRIIAPSESLALCSKKNVNDAKKNLESIGLEVSFSKNAMVKDRFDSSSIEERIKDLHEAFSDSQVHMIICARGGFNSNQLLDYIDFDLIKSNPKIFMGYSDITVLLNAIYAKTSLETYLGPNFSSFAKDLSLDYTIEYLKKILFKSDKVLIKSSNYWYDEWERNNDGDVKRFDNEGFVVIKNGSAKGKIIGGNINSFRLLFGTGNMPSIKDSILFLEDDADTVGEAMYSEFDRNLQSIIHLTDFPSVKGIVFGKFQVKSKMDVNKLKNIVDSKKELNNIPVIANVDFGHVKPMIIIPIGRNANIYSSETKQIIEIENY